MSRRSEPVTEHHPNWAKIAMLEVELYGETFHHEAPGCDCRECVHRRADWDRHLHEQTVQGWQTGWHEQ